MASWIEMAFGGPTRLCNSLQKILRIPIQHSGDAASSQITSRLPSFCKQIFAHTKVTVLTGFELSIGHVTFNVR